MSEHVAGQPIRVMMYGGTDEHSSPPEDIMSDWYKLLKENHAALSEFHDFTEEHVWPVVYNMAATGSQKQEAKSTAVIGTYYRMRCWVVSLLVLPEIEHFQAVGSGGRSLLELLVDLKLLEYDLVPNGVEKYSRFAEVCDYRLGRINVNVK